MFLKYQKFLFEKRHRADSPNFQNNRIQTDGYLSYMYKSAYASLLDGYVATNTKQNILEIGSSGNLIKCIDENIITSDLRNSPEIDMKIDAASNLPFEDEFFDLIVGKDVMHHINNLDIHFQEVIRVLKPGGQIRYFEPNWNILSMFIFTFLHPEPFDKKQEQWKFTSDDPMYSNQALPFIVFVRDIEIFNAKYPNLSVKLERKPINGLAFLLSGGVYSRTFLPSKFLICLDKIENKSELWMRLFGFNKLIIISKK